MTYSWACHLLLVILIVQNLTTKRHDLKHLKFPLKTDASQRLYGLLIFRKQWECLSLSLCNEFE